MLLTMSSMCGVAKVWDVKEAAWRLRLLGMTPRSSYSANHVRPGTSNGVNSSQLVNQRDETKVHLTLGSERARAKNCKLDCGGCTWIKLCWRTVLGLDGEIHDWWILNSAHGLLRQRDVKRQSQGVLPPMPGRLHGWHVLVCLCSHAEK
jgi:hypothetical protein